MRITFLLGALLFASVATSADVANIAYISGGDGWETVHIDCTNGVHTTVTVTSGNAEFYAWSFCYRSDLGGGDGDLGCGDDPCPF